MVLLGRQTFIWRFFAKLVHGYTAQKMKFSIKDFFSKCGQIRSLKAICCFYKNSPSQMFDSARFKHTSGINK